MAIIMESNQGIINSSDNDDPAVITNGSPGSAATTTTTTSTDDVDDKPESTSDNLNEATTTLSKPELEQNSSDEVKHNANGNSVDKQANRVVGQGKLTPNVPTGPKRVRFSICEYITETFVQEEAHENPAFDENEKENMENGRPDSDVEGDAGGNKMRYIGGRLRRDSVHPLVGFQIQPIGKSEDDKWAVYSPDSNGDNEDESDEDPWSELSTKAKVIRVLTAIGKFIALLGLLYFFVCSLDLLSLGFRLVGGSTAGEIFRQSSILQNPIVGLMIGILTTVLVQSSSTSTSIIVGMVAAGFMDVPIAIPPIMGANIGTSITNTIVSFTQAGDRDQFRRAFAGATILDMFNWITVVVLLPIEVITGYLYHVSKATVDLIIPDSQSGGEIQVLSVITRPFVDLIVQLNDTVLECWATPNCTDADGASLIKEFCSTVKTKIYVESKVVDKNGREILHSNDVTSQEDLQRCDFLFAGTSMSDAAVGAIILVASLLVLCFCLVMIVKLLSSVLEGHVAKIIKRTLNADIPYVPWITGYIAILIGAVMTFLVQSSSVFTSALTPLVGLGVISLDRVYPLTLGANIGTTTTALLASMAAEGKSLHPSLQIALCHFFFNITGVLLFYPVPFLRFPIGMAKVLGNTTAKYRWFAILYLVGMFAVLPAVFILLSLAGSIYVIVLVSIVGVIALIVIVITMLQRKVPKVLPEKMRDWKWLPEPMRSLRPYDKLMTKMPCACCKRSKEDDDDDDDSDDDTYHGRRPTVYKDNDFVFLTGNKIPPPNGYTTADDQQQPNQRPSITRIVPTRVIRNISNGNGATTTDHGRSNGHKTINGDDIGLKTDHTLVPIENGTVAPDSSSVSGSEIRTNLLNKHDTNNSLHNAENNTLPVPEFNDNGNDDESRRIGEGTNNDSKNIVKNGTTVVSKSKPDDNNCGNPAINLAYDPSSSTESFSV